MDLAQYAISEGGEGSISIPYFDGRSATSPGGTVSISIKNGDTTTPLIYRTDITEGTVVSMHTEDDSTSYQNTSGNTAYAVLIIRAADGGTNERHVKIYSSPNDDSTTSATLLFEVGSNTTNSILDASDEKLTTPILEIQNNEYLVIENVDESRAGTNSIDINDLSFVVERG